MLDEDFEDLSWIKLYRKSLKSQVFAASGKLWKVWCWCLMKANYEEKWVSFTTGRSISEKRVMPGQFIFGRKTAAKELKIKPSTVWGCMQKLRQISCITLKTDTHCTIVTICNWDTYQCNHEGNRQATNRQPTGNQQATDTDKNIKKDKNVKKKDIASPFGDAEAKVSKPREPNPIWDAICEIWNLKPVTKSELKNMGRLARDYKLKEATPNEIKRRLSRYRREWPDAADTPDALLKHWDRFAVEKNPDDVLGQFMTGGYIPRNPTPEEIAMCADLDDPEIIERFKPKENKS